MESNGGALQFNINFFIKYKYLLLNYTYLLFYIIKIYIQLIGGIKI